VLAPMALAQYPELAQLFVGVPPLQIHSSTGLSVVATPGNANISLSLALNRNMTHFLAARLLLSCENRWAMSSR
jgi:hypothetical protein